MIAQLLTVFAATNRMHSCIQNEVYMALQSIRELVDQDLALTDQFIISQLNTHIPMVKDILNYVLSSGGKRIRPLILLLSAKALAAQSKQHIDLAAVIELIHTATLLHDDVVDFSTLRRGQQTAHLVWGGNASVLVGDFLYSRAFQIVVDMKNEIILDIFAKATHYIAEGEIMQLMNCNNPDTTEDLYFDIIQRKTAKLFEIAAQLGGMSASNNLEYIEALRQYGLHLGLAYQLIDDALDYSQSPDETGKNMGQDIAEGKTTLPLIYAMQNSTEGDLNLLRKTVQTGEELNLTAIMRIIESTKAIEYTAQTARKHMLAAKEALKILPSSPYSEALTSLSEFVVARTY